MEAVALGQVVSWLDAEVSGAPGPDGRDDALLLSVSTDTRSLRPGALFFALDGDSFDGTRFVQAAFARGARAAVVPRGCTVDVGPGRPLLRVDDVRGALAALARGYRDLLGFKVVAITGSAGKTTTKDLIYHLLRGRKGVVRAPSSFNNDIGVPITLLSADRATDVAVVEVGTSGPGEIGRLGAIARPDVAVLTCIAPAHLEGLGSIDGVAREKLSLLEHLRPGGVAVLNGDDPRLRAAASALVAARGPSAVRTCGLGQDLDWRPERVAGRLPVPGEPFLRSALLSLAAVDALGVDAAGLDLAGFRPPPGRMNVTTLLGVTLVDDTYNANPASVGASLQTLASIAAPEARLVVLGGMAELGRDGPEHHRAIGRDAARLGLRLLVTVGEDARQIAEGARRAGAAPERVVEVASADDVHAVVAPLLAHGRALLFKASRVHKLERAVAAVRAALLQPAARARAAA